MTTTQDVFIVNGARTAFGDYLGSFKNLDSTTLGIAAAKAALQKSGVDPKGIDHSVFGNVIQSSPRAIYTARHIALGVGVPKEVPALTLNRLCGSGAEAIVQSAYLILTGEADLVLAGGAENMTQIPHVIRNGRFGAKFGDITAKDYLWESLFDTECGIQMGETAEELAKDMGITRQMSDEYALTTQTRYKAAFDRGFFKDEIVPVEVTEGKKTRTVTEDEHFRAGTTLEGLAALKPVFRKDGIVTAGSASGIVDGAASVVVASERKVKELGLKPIGRLVRWGHAGVEPRIMGYGPVPAIQKALKKAGKSLGDVDLVEVNEAFVAQYLAVEKGLGLDRAKTNVNGGATAVGHPLAATGTRLTLTVLRELRARGKKLGIASMCIGGGQGIALLVEALA